MSKNFSKRIMCLCLCFAILVSVAMIPASAVSSNSKETVIYGENARATATLYPTQTSAYTYCELASAGKMAKAYFVYIDKNGVQSTVTKGSLSKYTYNNSTSLTNKTASPSDYNMTVKAYGKHKVKIMDGIVWEVTVNVN